MADYKKKKGASGKKYTTLGEQILVTYTDGSTRRVKPGDDTYNATKEAMQKDIKANKFWKPAGNSKTTAQTAVGKGVTDGIITTAEKNKLAEQAQAAAKQRKQAQAVRKVADGRSKQPATEQAKVMNNAINTMIAKKAVDTAKSVPKVVKSGVEHGVHNTIAGTKQGAVSGMSNLGRGGMASAMPYMAVAEKLGAVKPGTHTDLMQQQKDGMEALQRVIAENTRRKSQQISDKYGPMSNSEQFISDFIAGLLPVGAAVAGGAIAGPAGAIAPMYNYAKGASVTQALNDGADYDEAQAYGIGKGAVDTGASMIFKGMAGLPGKFKVGEKVAGKIANPALKKAGGAIADVASEGAEEALAEIIDPFLQRATYNEDAKLDWNRVLESAIMGSLTAGAFNAGAAGLRNLPKIAGNMQENDQQRAFDALHSQKFQPKQVESAETAQDSPEQAQSILATEHFNGIENGAQKQNMQVDFQQNQAKIMQEAQPVKNVQNGGKKEESAVENLQNEMKNLRYQQLQFVSDMIDKVRSGHEPTNTEQKRIDRILERLGIEEAFYGSDISVIDDKIAEEMAAYENRNGIEAGERQMQKTVAEQSPMIETENAAAEEPSMVEYEDYDARKLSRDVFDFYSQVGKVGGKAHFNIRVVQKLEHDAEGKSDGRGNILISAERANDIETIRRVVAHEVYHEMKNTPEWGNIQDLAYELYKLEYPDGTQEDMLQAKIDQYHKLSKGAVQLDFDAAWDEIGAEMMGKILSNPKMADRVWNQNPTLAQRIKRWLEDMVAKLYDYVTISGEDSIYRRALEAYSDGLKNMEYRRGAALEGGTNSSSLDADNDNANVNVTNEAGEVVAEQRGSEIRFSLGSHEDGGRDVLHQYVDEMVKKGKMDADFGKTVIEQLETMYKSIKKLTQGSNADKYSYFTAWSEVMPQFDENGKLILSVATPNGEYPMNLDFSTRCAKRVAIDTLLMHMSASGIYDISQLTPSDFAMINQILKDHNLATACTMCFVETKRDRSAGWANTIVDEYNELLQAANIKNGVVDEASLMAKRKEMDGRKENKTSMAMSERYAKYLRANANNPIQLKASDLMHSEGMERVKREAPDIYSIASSRYGAGTPKPLTAEGAYANELINPDKKRKQKGGKKKNPYIWKAEDAFKVGGVRLQSFSDFRVEMFFDYCQMIAEASLKGLPIQSYTKVPAFAKLFGMTGIKINLSLVPEVELTAEERAYVDSLTDKQKKTDARFKEIQGRAGLNSKGEYLWAGESFDPKLAYRLQDNDMYTNNVGTVAIGVSDAQIWQMLKDKNIRMIIPYHKSGIDAGVARAKNIDVFKNYESYQNHLIIDENLPMMPNESYAQYYRRLANMDKYGSKPTKKGFNFDFYGALKKLNDPVKVSKQYVDECQKRNIAPKFPQFVYNQDGSFNENYYKMLIDFAVYNKDGKYAPQQAVKFDSEHLPKDWLKTLRKELAIDESERKRMDSEIASVADDVVSRLKPKKDSMYSLSPKQEEYFKDSKVRDENGNLKVMYHGTSSHGFNVFDYGKVKFGLFGSGFYFTDNESVAESYTEKGKGDNKGIYKVYLNITNPIDMDAPANAEWYDVDLNGEDITEYLEVPERKQPTNEDYFRALKNYCQDSGMYRYEAEEYIQDIILGMGFDGISHIGGGRYNKKDETRHRVYIAFEQEQIKNVDNQNPTSDADIRYSVGKKRDAVGSQEYKDLLDEHGSIPEGENPTGENYRVEVPRKGLDGKKVREFVRTIMEAPSVDDAVANMFAQELIDPEQVLSGILTMESTSNKALVDVANESIATKGWQQNYKDLHSRMTTGDKITAQDIALATRVAQEAQKAGDAHATFDILTDLTVVASEFGQGLQAVKILKRLSPEGQLMAFMKTQKRINDSLEKQGKKRVKTMSKETAEEFLKARGNKKRDEIMARELARMGQETEGTWTDKLDALRYAGMLSNPKTHLRNIFGNIIMAVVHQPTVAISAAIEDATRLGQKALRPNGVPAEQYRSLVNRSGNSYMELRDYANQVFKEIEPVLRAGGSRYSDTHGGFRQNQRVFGHSLPGKFLEQYAGNGRFSVSSALEGEDMLAKHLAFNSALAGYMKANGISVKEAVNGVVKPNGASIERGKEYAFKQAQRATFTEENRAADALGRLENTNAASKVLMGGLMPFKKTPMNILTRGFEYSPAGLAMTFYKLKYAATNSSDKYERAYNMNDVFESLAANMTGTALMYLGYKMAEAGLLAGAADDDNERKSRYDQLMGSQEYALTDPDTGDSWTIDWLAPVAMPLFAGAEVFNQVLMRNENAGDADYDSMIVSALGRIIEPVFEMSCMQGVSDALASYSSGGTEFASSVATTLVTGYAGQFAPQPMAAWARAIDDTVRSSYAPKDSPVLFGKAGETFARQMANRIPIASQYMQPSIDVWGNERKREFAGDEMEQVLARTFNNFLNPGTYSSNKRTELDLTLEALYKSTGDSGVLPKSATNYVTVDGTNYHKTPAEKTAYDRTKGQKSKQYVSDFVNSSTYANLDNTTKTKIIEELYNLADYEAKKEMLGNRDIDYSDSQYENVLDSGVSPHEYYTTKQRFGGKFDQYNHAVKYAGYADQMQMKDEKFVEVYDSLGDLHADKDKNGKSKSGSRRKKVETYLDEERSAGRITKEQYWYFLTKEYPSEAKNAPYAWIREANKQ